jgi:hypothetical protein
MIENFPAGHTKPHCMGDAVQPNHAHARPTPEPLIHREGGATLFGLTFVQITLGQAFLSGRRLEETFGRLKHPQSLPFLDPFRQLIRFGDVFQQVIKIFVRNPLDFHPTVPRSLSARLI